MTNSSLVLYTKSYKSHISLAWIILPLICCLYAFSIYDKYILSVFCLIEFALIVIALLRNNTKVMSFSFFFIALIFVFHCGYCVLWAFKYPFNESVVRKIDDLTWCLTIKFSMLFLLLCSIGIIIANIKKHNVKRDNKKYIKVDQIRNIGCVLTILFLIPRVYIDILYIVAGYSNAFSLDVNGFVETFAEGFYIGLLFLLVGFKEKKNASRIIFIVGMLFCIIGMISGRRQEKVVFAIALIFVFFSGAKTNKHNIGKAIVSVFVCYIFLALIASFGDVRKNGFSVPLFLERFIANLSYKLLFDQFEEFGSASYTLAACIKCFPGSGVGFGQNYFLSLITIFPQIGDMASISSGLSFVKQIPDEYYFWLGGSLLGEFYYNFGFLSILLFVPFGYFIGRVSCSISNALYDKKYDNFFLASVIIVAPIFLWIRGSFVYIPRTFVWMLIISILCKRFKLFAK